MAVFMISLEVAVTRVTLQAVSNKRQCVSNSAQFASPPLSGHTGMESFGAQEPKAVLYLVSHLFSLDSP